jgi:hypothetical protein
MIRLEGPTCGARHTRVVPRDRSSSRKHFGDRRMNKQSLPSSSGRTRLRDRQLAIVSQMLRLALAIAFLHPGVASASSGGILTPAPGPKPKINGPSVYGARPGRPFLYRIPCTGLRPIRFSTTGLPASLSVNEETGIIEGHAPQANGAYTIIIKASNRKSVARRKFTIMVGDRIALTPPMGWNDWYTHYDNVTDSVVRQAADAMIASGMADFGYQYVNIDDAWMVKPEASTLCSEVSRATPMVQFGRIAAFPT